MDVANWRRLPSASQTAMNGARRKVLRRIASVLDRLYSPRGWKVPTSIADLDVPNVLTRKLRLKGHRTLLLTDSGLDDLRAVASEIEDTAEFDGRANYSDIYAACRAVLEETLSSRLRPDDAEEFIQLVKDRLAPRIDDWTFAVPIYGIELVDVKSLELGSLKVVVAAASLLNEWGVQHLEERAQKTIELTRARYWLVGSAAGTAAVAQEQFRAQAELAVGMLAISAASMFEHGARSFRIGVVMSPEEAYGAAAWFSWPKRIPSLTTHHKYVRSQGFKIDAELIGQFDGAGVLAKAFSIFQSGERTPLEEAFVRAVYWYSDAHREAVSVMKLIKYWSCVETFFSAENKGITRSVSVGLASVVAFGRFRFVALEDYEEVKRRAVKLYGLRSRAVHGAAHRHVSDRDAADLSQWVAWMLINIIDLIHRGYTRPDELRETSVQLDSQATALIGEAGTQ